MKETAPEDVIGRNNFFAYCYQQTKNFVGGIVIVLR